MPSQWPQSLNRSALRIRVVAENPVIDECRKRAFAVEIHSVVIVGDDDGHEDSQKSDNHAEIRADIWWWLLCVWLVVVVFLLLGWLGGDVLDGLSLAEVGHCNGGGL